jgi:hypothetical protein
MSASPTTKMPMPLADLHQRIGDDLTRLCLNWKEYVTLCATNERRTALRHLFTDDS